MRLICPNCGAQYEVDDSLIPEDGRDVQCSNCGHGWYQLPAGADAGLAAELAAEPAPEDDAADRPAPAARPDTDDEDGPGDGDEAEDAEVEDTPAKPAPEPGTRRPTMTSEVRDILAEEAAREAKARHGDTGIETQGDLGLDEPRPKRPAGIRERTPRPPAQDVERLDEDGPADTAQAIETAPATAAGAGATVAATGPRRELLPDIEEINSSLRSAEERNADDVIEHTPARKQSGFGIGFTIVVVVALVAVGLYAFAAPISRSAPAAAPYLDAYVTWADGLRSWLDRVAQGWVQKLTAMVAGGGSAG